MPEEDALVTAKEMIEKSQEKATEHTKLVIGLGYAALFAVFSATKNDLTKEQRLLAGLFALTSLTIYGSVEIWAMFRHARNQLSFQNLAKSSPDLGSALGAYVELQKPFVRRFPRIWFTTLALVISTGLCAALVLIYSFVAQLLH